MFSLTIRSDREVVSFVLQQIKNWEKIEGKRKMGSAGNKICAAIPMHVAFYHGK
jgi:hypothetical protein